jgi:hypothetical protein
MHRQIYIFLKKTSLWGSPEYTERSMRHWINVGTGCVFSTTSSSVLDLKLILKIYDPVKSAQSALVEGALPYDGSSEHHEWTSASHPSNGTGKTGRNIADYC